MQTTTAPHRTAASVVEAYIRGKDGNRPHLMRAAFADDAQLTMRVRTAGISFPPGAIGRSAIADLLASRFNQSWENVYTLCMGEPPAAGATSLSCDWLVVMSAKSDGSVRAGCGRYDWSFRADTGLVRSLVITIDAMEAVACSFDEIGEWVAQLPYPWCDARRLASGAPDKGALRAVLARLSSTIPIGELAPSGGPRSTAVD